MVPPKASSTSMPQAQFDKLKERFNKHPILEVDLLSNQKLALDDWEKKGSPHVLVKVCEWGRYQGWMDCGYGFDCLWDGLAWEVKRKGVFQEEVVFLTDYYGYPEGKLFISSTVAH